VHASLLSKAPSITLLQSEQSCPAISRKLRWVFGVGFDSLWQVIIILAGGIAPPATNAFGDIY